MLLLNTSWLFYDVSRLSEPYMIQTAGLDQN
jgi:hypothetical protein